MKNPSEELTDFIAQLLVDREIFLQEDIQKHKSKIADGSMKSEDWLLAIEKRLEKKTEE